MKLSKTRDLPEPVQYDHEVIIRWKAPGGASPAWSQSAADAITSEAMREMLSNGVQELSIYDCPIVPNLSKECVTCGLQYPSDWTETCDNCDSEVVRCDSDGGNVKQKSSS